MFLQSREIYCLLPKQRDYRAVTSTRYAERKLIPTYMVNYRATLNVIAFSHGHLTVG